MSFFGRVLGILGWRPGIAADQREAILAYVVQELTLQAFQDSEVGLYNGALVRAGSLPEGGPDAAATAAKRLSQAATQLVQRHAGLGPIPDGALAVYARWHGAYRAYAQWASAMVTVYEQLQAGLAPVVQGAARLHAEEEDARQRAVEEMEELCRRLGVREEEAQRLAQEAKAAAQSQWWDPGD